ncbi:7482_t:CDS:1 [Funneliformis caledonium]|uniref:7482_t:CDS:1 n=1 Tax=Funneliformis caledonium TaxID=1117310 RepID=A0A9N8YT06_9GLOM|nr:7482_t:CDS:1 [Funneliformis caledonium]
MSTSLDTQGGNGSSNINAIQDASASSESTLAFILFIVKKVTFEELTKELLSNHFYSSYNYLNLNNVFVFYFQYPNDQRIYHIACEMVPYSAIVQHLNLNVFGIELTTTNPLKFT